MQIDVLKSKLKKELWIYPSIALLVLAIGHFCKIDGCAMLSGDILGIDLNIIGAIYFSLLFASIYIFRKTKDYALTALLTAAGIGAEAIFFSYQISNSVYCPKCITAGITLIPLFILTRGYIRKRVLTAMVLLGLIVTSITFNGSILPSYAANYEPSFGNKKASTEVIIYTDYMCPSCFQAETPMNNELIKMQSKVKIRFIDIPMHKESVPLAEAFVYFATESTGDLLLALHVRDILFKTGALGGTQQSVYNAFASQKIPYTANSANFNQMISDYYIPLLKKDRVKKTPSVVIVRNGKRTLYTGQTDALAALTKLNKVL